MSAREVYGICTVCLLFLGNSSGGGVHSGYLKPHWEPPSVVNEKSFEGFSLCSSFSLPFPDALSGNEAANFIHSLGC